MFSKDHVVAHVGCRLDRHTWGDEAFLIGGIVFIDYPLGLLGREFLDFY